ncbi:MAG: RNA polymerase subunit sigma-24 [Bacteroidia bacterium]|nr:MAG: RNA polymerase subunit sigma-24 [Bacteroidia bacterium]
MLIDGNSVATCSRPTVLPEREDVSSERAIASRLDEVRPSVYAYVLSSVKDAVLAKDLVQDTLLKACLALRVGTYREDGRFESWVMRVARNVIVDHYRERRRATLVDLPLDWQHQHVVSHESNPEEALVRVQERLMVRRLVDSLPERQREVVLLRHYVGMSFQEIADHTGVSINTALGRMRYALINLRKLHSQQEVA